LYGLTVEPHTPLGRWQSRGDISEGSEERYETEFRHAHARLTGAGFEHYEVSNFALPSRRARHNSAYWQGVPYLGIGPSAHGFDGTNRRWNTSAYAAWGPAAIAGSDPIDGSERLTPDNRCAEGVYLGLRTRDGLAISSHEAEHTARWHAEGWIEYLTVGEELRLRCTAEGWLRLDALAADLTALRSRS
jgi:oxygen-independent coproporphyrinogen-3 oxidase